MIHRCKLEYSLVRFGTQCRNRMSQTYIYIVFTSSGCWASSPSFLHAVFSHFIFLKPELGNFLYQPLFRTPSLRLSPLYMKVRDIPKLPDNYWAKISFPLFKQLRTLGCKLPRHTLIDRIIQIHHLNPLLFLNLLIPLLILVLSGHYIIQTRIKTKKFMILMKII